MKTIKTYLVPLLLLIISISCNFSREDPVSSIPGSQVYKGYDSLTAADYGADPYGMKKYVFAFLRKGPNRDQDSTRAAELQHAHLQNIMKMADQGKLVLAGPFLEEGELRGIYIFNVETVEEAEALTNTDPAIQAGRLKMELKEWYGSAALMAVNELHKTLAKQSVADG